MKIWIIGVQPVLIIKTGDGAGILMQIPDQYIREVLKVNIPASGNYGTGLIFLPQDRDEASVCVEVLTKFIKQEGLDLIEYRDVAVDSSAPGEIAKQTEPYVKQVYIKANLEQDVLEQKLYLVRKQAEKEIRESKLKYRKAFYIPSLSSKVIIYKGMLTPGQLRDYYKDLTHPKFTSAIALVHSRFSTNTFPTWDLAQPFRMIAHNGEINTVKGNRFVDAGS